MSPRICAAESARSSFPRVSGDEPPTNTIGTTNAKFSPRERG